MTIKHLVLSSGGLNGLNILGCLYKAYELDHFKRKDIVSVYGCSAGSIVLTIWLLNITKEDTYNFIINCPWDKTFKFGNNIITNIFNMKGFVSKDFLIDILSPLLKSQSLNINITLKEFYEFTKKDFYILSTKVNALEIINISHKTHPDLELIDAIYMSSSVPLIMQPIYYNNSYMLDGALKISYPIKFCLENGAKEDEIFGIKVRRLIDKSTIDEKDSLIQFITTIIENMKKQLDDINDYSIKNQVIIYDTRFKDLDKIISCSNKRKEMIEVGENLFLQFLKNGGEELH